MVYIVLPLFGPSNLRDTSGMVMTMLTDQGNAYAVTEGEAWIVPIGLLQMQLIKVKNYR